MADLLSVSEAAAELKLSPARVRLLVSSGDLPAEKIGGRWLVEYGAVARRRRQGGFGGRRFKPENAWAILSLASGEEVSGLEPGPRSRFRRALALEGLEVLSPRLERRAEIVHYRSHPGEFAHLHGDRRILRSGAGAAREVDLDLMAGMKIDGYVGAAAFAGVVGEHALAEVSPVEANVVLRIVTAEVWERFLGDRQHAPAAAIALDLLEDADPRSQAAGHELIDRLERRKG